MSMILDWDNYKAYDDYDQLDFEIYVPVVGGGTVIFSYQPDEMHCLFVEEAAEELRAVLAETGFDIWGSLPGSEMTYEPTFLQMTIAILLMMQEISRKVKLYEQKVKFQDK